MAKQTQRELTAFCTACPPAEEVTTLLHGLGFTLTFELPADHALPAQHHYEGSRGTEVIYLAGADAPSYDDQDAYASPLKAFPEHRSRFWLYEGADPLLCKRVASALALRWPLSWHPAAEFQPGEEVA